jgi:Zn-dependent M28 family amino/carboxypeptidase
MRAFLLLICCLASSCQPRTPGQTTSAKTATQVPVAGASLLADVQVLASDSLEGRLTGAPGGLRARNYLVRRFGELGLRQFGGSYTQPFSFQNKRGDFQAANVVGYLEGTKRQDLSLVIVAHYDHLGVRDGKIFYGADDNASGVAALLAMAAHFRQHPPEHRVIFLAPDAEELGLRGSTFFVENPPVPREQMALVVNIDMISRNDQNELYACGPGHFPFLKAVMEKNPPNATVTLRYGHDQRGGAPGSDWSYASDHGPFFRKGIPFIYFGVEDHADYHRPTDTFANIQPAFFRAAVGLATDHVARLEKELAIIQAEKLKLGK